MTSLSHLLLGAICSTLIFAEGEKLFEYTRGRELQVAPAVADDGTIYVAGKGRVAAVSPAGEERWSLELLFRNTFDITGITVGPTAIYVVGAEGIFAISREGERLWNTQLTTSGGVAIDQDGFLYIGATGHKVISLRGDGSVRWTTEVTADHPRFISLPTPALSVAERVLVGGSPVYTLNRDGSIVGVPFPFPGYSMSFSPVVDEQGNVYSLVYGQVESVMTKYNSSGTELLRIQYDGKGTAPPVVAADGSIYLVLTPIFSPITNLRAFNSEGRLRWAHEIVNPICPVLLADGTVIVAGSERVQGLTKDGQLKWSYTLSAPAVQGVTVDGNGTIYVAQSNGTLLALAGSSPPAQGGWPMYGNNAKHTMRQSLQVLMNLRAEQVTATGANLVLEINPRGTATSVYFDIGTEQQLTRTFSQNVPGSSDFLTITQSISGLQPGKLYTARAVSSNSVGLAISGSIFIQPPGNSEQEPTVQALTAVGQLGGVLRFSRTGTIELTTPVEIKQDAEIDANGHTIILSGGRTTSIFKVAAGVELTLRGIQLVDGKAQGVIIAGVEQIGRGGAILNHGGNLRLIECTFSNNVAIGMNSGYSHAAGGALWHGGGSLVIGECRFLTNGAVGGDGFTGGGYGSAVGGAIFIENGSAQIRNSLFLGNFCTVRGGSYFGYVGGPAQGGAICNSSGEVVLSDSILRGNRVLGDSHGQSEGGAVCNRSGTLKILDSVLSENWVGRGAPDPRRRWFPENDTGGGAVFSSGSLFIESSSLVNNVAAGPTGGAIVNKGTIGLINSTLSGNSAGTSSALYHDGVGGITNCTIAWNRLAALAIYMRNSGLTLKNTLLVSNNVAQPTKGANAGPGIIDTGHNISTDHTPVFTQTSSRNQLNPMLGPLGLFGGKTPVHPIVAGSPAINAGDNTAAPATDQRGRPRPFGGQVDIGAFESSSPFYVMGTVQGYLDPTTTFSYGETQRTLEADGSFLLGPIAGGTTVNISAQSAVMRPNPWVLDLSADLIMKELVGFKKLSFNYDLTSGAQASRFVLAAEPGTRWKINSSENLDSWTELGTYVVGQSGYVDVSLPGPISRIFLRAQHLP